MTRIGIIGSAGRMGHALAQAITDAGAIASGGVEAGGDLAALAASSDVLIDFSVPAALAETLRIARLTGTALLIGTTGLDTAHHAAIDEAAGEIAVLQAANTALGVNLLAALVEQAATRLGADWDIEIVEMHHRDKVDAPSGTALLLGQAAARARGIALGPSPSAGRDGKRVRGSIGFASLRGGSVAGDHMVVLAGEGERLELGHRAESRAIFAHGAVRAACWLAGKPKGRYTMADVLGL